MIDFIPFIKTFSPDDWDFGEPTMQQIKFAHDGLRGSDLLEFIKRAGHRMADVVQRLDLKPGDIPVHNIAMGATEFWSPNRNGDGFKEASLEKYHPTFVKHARLFRNHKNKPSDPYFGIIKYSEYNPEMHRVELISVYNGTKEAAARNGGLVADEELEELAKHGQMSTSMSCKVPWDACSSCHNKARSRAEYCESVDFGGHCKAGGLKRNMGSYCGEDDAPILHADNPEPTFFDNSKVKRGADRAAYAVALAKEAGVHAPGGALLTEAWEVTAPAHLLAPEEVTPFYELAGYMTAATKRAFAQPDSWSWAFLPDARNPLPPLFAKASAAQISSALYQAQALLPIVDFTQLAAALSGGQAHKAAAAAERARPLIPAAFAKLADDAELPAHLGESPWRITARLNAEAKMWSSKCARDYSLARPYVERRRTLGLVRMGGEKQASGLVTNPATPMAAQASDPKAFSLAIKYAAYVLGAVANLATTSPEPALTLHLAAQAAVAR